MDLLIAAGAEMNLTDCDGKTALHLACTENHYDVIVQLLRYLMKQYVILVIGKSQRSLLSSHTVNDCVYCKKHEHLLFLGLILPFALPLVYVSKFTCTEKLNCYCRNTYVLLTYFLYIHF